MRAHYADGNRMVVPDVVNSKHFFYKTPSLAFELQQLQLVTKAALAYVDRFGLKPAEIGLLRFPELEFTLDGAGEALEQLLHAMTLPQGFDRSMAGVLVCEWVNPHIDRTFSGRAFINHVLHTGPEPYIMQTFHVFVPPTRPPQPGARTLPPVQNIESSTRVLEVGTTFLFDPTTAHMVAPRRPGDGQLLVLLQTFLKDETDADRAAILAAFPPGENDRDAHEVFNGYID